MKRYRRYILLSLVLGLVYVLLGFIGQNITLSVLAASDPPTREELLANRVESDGYWCSYPDQDYWYCGSTLSPYCCRYQPGESLACWSDCGQPSSAYLGAVVPQIKPTPIPAPQVLTVVVYERETLVIGTWTQPAPTAAPVPQAYRCGAICEDGWLSSATGSGACSWHGGVASWRYCYR